MGDTPDKLRGTQRIDDYLAANPALKAEKTDAAQNNPALLRQKYQTLKKSPIILLNKDLKFVEILLPLYRQMVTTR